MASPIAPPETDTDLSPDELAATDSAVADANDILAADTALAQARAQLGAMADAASAANALVSNAPDYSLHKVGGVGNYAIVRKTGWNPLLKLIRKKDISDDEAIDFSSKVNPGFDAIVGQHFKSPWLLDPLNEHYESYTPLRENIAAVRNFLMETYYANTPGGLTPEKAQQALAEIAEFVGEGLANNYEYLGIIPNHKSGKPHISIAQASLPGGAGAQYIYEQILAHHRQSSWLRPFAAVVSLFGGKPAPNWMLPAAHKTEFSDIFQNDIAPAVTATGPTPAELEAGIAAVDALEAKRNSLIEQQQLNNTAHDLDAMGNYLLYTATNLKDVAALADPVKRDAIEIAKDILRKLKISLGNINILDGLKLPPKDDLAALGAIKGVAMVYEKLLAYSRGLNPNILQDPSVMAATRAIGQIGYLAKLEALRMARFAGNAKLATTLSGELARIPAVYATPTDATFGGLLDKVESGINVLMSRSQTISGPGAFVGAAPAKSLGSSITAPPTAGLANQASLQPQQRSDIMTPARAAALAHHAETQRDAQTAQQSRQSQQQQAPSRGLGSRALGFARSVKQTVTGTSKSSSALNPTNPQQAANLRNLYSSHHQEEEHLHEEQQRLQLQQQRLMNDKLRAQKTAQKAATAQAAQKAAAAQKMQSIKLDANMLKSLHHPDLHEHPAVNPGEQGHGFTASVKPAAPKPPSTNPEGHDSLHPQVPPPNKGTGRGF